MLRLLLDEHISPVVAKELARTRTGIEVVSIHTWENGAHLGTAEPEILIAAALQKLTLVTFDQKNDVGSSGRSCGLRKRSWGVIFVDERTIAPHDFGGLIRALCDLWKTQNREVWTNQTVFLGRPKARQR